MVNEWDNLTAEQIVEIEKRVANSKAKLQAQQPQAPQNLLGNLLQPQPQAKLGVAPQAPQPAKIMGEIPKKIAAMEIIKHLNNSIKATAGFMIGMFATLLAAVFGKTPMYLVAAVFLVAAGVFLAFNKKEMVRLQTEYKI